MKRSLLGPLLGFLFLLLIGGSSQGQGFVLLPLELHCIGTQGDNGIYVSDVSCFWDPIPQDAILETVVGCEDMQFVVDTPPEGVLMECYGQRTNGGNFRGGFLIGSELFPAIIKRDTTPPTLELLSPTFPLVVDEGSKVTFEAIAQDNFGPPAVLWDADNDGSYESPNPLILDVPDSLSGWVVSSMVVAIDQAGSETHLELPVDQVTVNNVAPGIDSMTGPEATYVGGTVDFLAEFTDPGLEDSHTAYFNWGDGAVTQGLIAGGPGGGTVTGQHTYTQQGVFPVTLTISDTEGGTVTGSKEVTALYDVQGTLGQNGYFTSDISITGPVLEPGWSILEGCQDQLIDYDTSGEELHCLLDTQSGPIDHTLTIKRDATPPQSQLGSTLQVRQGTSIEMDASPFFVDPVSGLGELLWDLEGLQLFQIANGFIYEVGPDLPPGELEPPWQILASDLAGNEAITEVTIDVISGEAWFVAVSGSDDNDCRSPVTACLTINGVLDKEDFVAGDLVLVAGGTYSDSGPREEPPPDPSPYYPEVVLLDKDVHISGGWNSFFTLQTRSTIIDGRDEVRGITVKAGVTAVIDNLIVQNGKTGLALSYPAREPGAGIRNQGILTLNNSWIRYNTGWEAAGIFNDGQAVLNHTAVIGNSSTGLGRVGGVINEGILELNSSKINENEGELVGGFLNRNNGQAVLNDSQLHANTSSSILTSVGGIDNEGELVLNNSTVSDHETVTHGSVAGIRNSGHAVLNGSTVSGNITEGSGGGIYNSEELELYDSTIRDNVALTPFDPLGRQVTLGGGIFSVGNLIMIDSKITHNKSVGGGGIAIQPGGTALLERSEVSHNEAFWDAGISNFGDLEINRSVVSYNRHSSDYHLLYDGAAGIINGPHSHLIINQSTIHRNIGFLKGGLWSAGIVEVNQSTFSDNISLNFSGGIVNSGELSIRNSTLSDNKSLVLGGAITNGGDGDLNIENATISHNSSDLTYSGIPPTGGILSFGEFTTNLRNTIVADNIGSDCIGTVRSSGHNLDSDGSCGFSAPGDISSTDPFLGPLQNSGGQTKTRALTEGSPAIDAGSPAAPGSGGSACLTTDQRGFNRPQDGDGDGSFVCDIGAYELITQQPMATTTLPPVVELPPSASFFANEPVVLSAVVTAPWAEQNHLFTFEWYVGDETIVKQATLADQPIQIAPTFADNGSHLVGLWVTGSETGGAAQVVNISPDTPDGSGPVAEPFVTAILGNDEWAVSSVAFVSWAVFPFDNEDCPAAVISVDTAGTAVSCTVTFAGQTTTESVTIKLDSTPPEVVVTGVANGEIYVFGNVPAPGCNTLDVTSGVATPAGLTVTGGDADGLGNFTATCDGATDNAGNSGSTSVSYTVVTPQAALQDLIDEVDGLHDSGVINQGQANSLTSKLQNAGMKLDSEKPDTAVNIIEAFMDEVQDLVNGGTLTGEQGQYLNIKAQNIIDAINNY